MREQLVCSERLAFGRGVVVGVLHWQNVREMAALGIAYWELDVNRRIEVRRDPSWWLWGEERERERERDWGNYWREEGRF